MGSQHVSLKLCPSSPQDPIGLTRLGPPVVCAFRLRLTARWAAGAVFDGPPGRWQNHGPVGSADGWLVGGGRLPDMRGEEAEEATVN